MSSASAETLAGSRKVITSRHDKSIWGADFFIDCPFSLYCFKNTASLLLYDTLIIVEKIRLGKNDASPSVVSLPDTQKGCLQYGRNFGEKA